MIRTVLRRALNYSLPVTSYRTVYKFSSIKQDKNASSYKTSGVKSSYWIDSFPYRSNTSPLRADISVDTCVIGGGIAGLTTAYLLAKQGQRVAVLEDGEVASGETGRTTGYLTWVIDDGLHNIADIYGKEGARLHVESHRAAVDIVEDIVRSEGIECEFRRVPSYWISHKMRREQEGDVDTDIRSEYEAMLDAGMDVSIVDRPPYAADDGRCIRIPGQGQFHSVAYSHGLVEAIKRAGGQVYTNSKVQDYRDGQQPWARTIDNYTVTSDNIVVATNIPLQRITSVFKMESYRTYVVAGAVPKGKYEWCIFQDDSMLNDEPYKYGRFTSLNETHDLLVVGGEDHLVGFENDYEERYQAIEDWVSERYPDIEFTYRWSGQVQEPNDLIASIGLELGAQKTYVITGDSGLGLTHGTLGGKIVSDLILGYSNPYKDLYDPTRVKLSTAWDVVSHLVEVDSQYTDYLKGGDVTYTHQIPPGEGAIIRRGPKYYAVYKDEEGQVFAQTAVCPHLKGLVRWNSTEKSWDCPLHGSRFDKFGKTLIGPSIDDLEPVNTDDVR